MLGLILLEEAVSRLECLVGLSAWLERSLKLRLEEDVTLLLDGSRQSGRVLRRID